MNLELTGEEWEFLIKRTRFAEIYALKGLSRHRQGMESDPIKMRILLNKLRNGFLEHGRECISGEHIA